MLKAPELLAAHHGIDGFSCGVPVLDDWLKKRARRNHVSGASRTYVVADETDAVVAYYALASGALLQAEAPGAVRRNMPDPIPMAILGRLAVDEKHHGTGLGAAIFQDAVLRVRQAADVLGIRGIVVHAISDDACRFYKHHGFRAGPASLMTMILPLNALGYISTAGVHGNFVGRYE